MVIRDIHNVRAGLSILLGHRTVTPMASGPRDYALVATLDLFATGVALMRQNLRRRHRDASDAAIDRMLQEWLHQRPGAEGGDASGPGVVPRAGR